MTNKTLRLLNAALALALAIIVGWSIIAGNLFVPIAAIVIAIGISYVLRRLAKEVTKDERTALLYEKAAGATIRVCVPIAAFVALVLFGLRERISPEMVTSAYVLAYVSCGMLIAHSLFYSYYNSKH